jgi:UPF0755 protein
MSRKNIVISISVALAAVAAATAWCGYSIFGAGFHATRTEHVCIDRDDTSDSIIDKVRKAGNGSNMSGFRLAAALRGGLGKVRVGRYSLSEGDNAFSLVNRMVNGRQAPVNLVVGSARTTDMLARNLSRQLLADSAEIAQAIHDTIFQRANGYNDSTIIALFLPDTYQVYWDITTDELMRRMLREHDTYWNDERRALADSLGMSIIEVTTLASIVDEETNDNAEKPTVAGLYINRLNKGIPLQADPTVKFAVRDFTLKRISGEHLKFDSPYNTYIYKGLPPGPIRLPSKRGIESVLRHERHNYIYMCAKDDFSGSHTFTANYNEHLKNARNYRKALDKIGISL